MQAELKIIGKPFKYEDFEDEMNVYQSSNPNEVSKIGDLIYVLFTNENRIYTINYDENIEYIGNYTADNEELSNVFYIYHTSDNTIEKVSLDDSRVSYDEANNKYIFNIMNEVKKGYLYGGYANNYGGSTLTEEEIKACKYLKTNATVNLQYSNTGNIGGYWSKDKAGEAYTGVEGTFSYGNFYKEKGTEMNPENGKIYYLKEVSSAYLVPFSHYLYVLSTKKITRWDSFFAIDDANYREVAFDIKEDNEEEAESFKCTVSRKFPYESGNKITVFTPEYIYDGMAESMGYDVNHKMKDVENGGTNYLACVNITSTKYFKENIRFKLQPYVVTKDKIKVLGTAWYYTVGELKKGQVRWTKVSY